MAEPKTKKTDASVAKFLDAIANETMRRDCGTVAKLMQGVTGEKPKMWGASIVGFGSYHYRYASGQEGDWPLLAFSPRKQNLTIYVLGLQDFGALVERLGPCKTAKVCVYLKSLEGIDMKVLEQLLTKSAAATKKRYGAAGRGR
jgi:hypothetical protein